MPLIVLLEKPFHERNKDQFYLQGKRIDKEENISEDFPFISPAVFVMIRALTK